MNQPSPSPDDWRWPVDPPRNPDFRAQVWERIDRERAATVQFVPWARRHVRGMTAAAALAMVLAGVAGSVAARGLADSQARNDDWVDPYLQTIDPHRMVAANHHTP